MLVLKLQKNSGIIFNTENANEIHLDLDFFNLFQKEINNLKTTKNKKIKNLLKKIEATSLDYRIINTTNQSKINTPNLADVNITNKCNLNCPHCYIDSNSNMDEMSKSDFDLVIKECQKLGILQIALGGGEPSIHPHLGYFLKQTRENNIVPNLTSNGKHLSWKNIYHIKRYAGAIALSIEEIGDAFEIRRNFPFKQFVRSVKKIKAAKINLVFQITLSKNNLKSIKKTLDFLLEYQPYGIIFLAYKPQGRGKDYHDGPISEADTKLVNKTIDQIFSHRNSKTKIGFDCCLTPALLSHNTTNKYLSCSASKTSLAIMPNLDAVPCSFVNKNQNFDNIKNSSLLDIWQGKKFQAFRNSFQNNINNSCQNCPKLADCQGGCPLFKLTNCNYK